MLGVDQENIVGGWRQALVLIIQHWEKALILAVLIVLIILVSVKVRQLDRQ